jgi:RNA polymerase sigma-70 factor, ECF subfamily
MTSMSLAATAPGYRMGPGLDRAATRADEDRMAAVYRQYGVMLHTYATRLVRDPRLAEDIVQETMLRCWQRAEMYDPARGTLQAWLHRIVHNIAVDKIRSRNARPQEVAELAGFESAVTPDHADSVVRAAAVRQAVAQLTPEHRAALVECYYRHRTVAEAAVILGVPAGTVKSRLYYAMRTLRGLLAAPDDAADLAAGPGRLPVMA